MAKSLLSLLVAILISPTASGAAPKLTETDKKVDQAIQKALKYLKGTQRSDGSWSAGSRANPAITALSVMAFLSAGHVPGEGPYAQTLEKGIRAVMKQQRGNGLIADNAGHEMYHHGICTLMLSEVVGMTEGKLAAEIRSRLEKAVAIILKAQRMTRNSHRGGWRYRVAGYDSDISVTGWQIMALRAAKNVGCDVPPERITMAVDYLKRCQDRRSGGFRYSPYGGVTVPCTGTSILALELCGKQHHHSPEAKKGGAYLLKYPPRWNGRFFFYSIYYCSQATFQLGGNYWASFKPKMHQVLLRYQSSNGAWRGGSYGANYSTAMCVLALTVEYRFLPIYQRGNEPLDRK